jgi:hypothetical protein
VNGRSHPKPAIEWLKSEGQKRLKPNASERRRRTSLKRQSTRKLGVRVVAMSGKEQAEKTQDQILRLFFQGVLGRQPKTDQELKEWLTSPVGRAAVMFDATSLSRWGETGRS